MHGEESQKNMLTIEQQDLDGSPSKDYGVNDN